MISRLMNKNTLKLLREVWSERKKALREEIDTVMKLAGEEKPILAPGLKVCNKDGETFTICSLGEEAVLLQDGPGNKMQVDLDTFEKEFELK